MGREGETTFVTNSNLGLPGASTSGHGTRDGSTGSSRAVLPEDNTTRAVRPTSGSRAYRFYFSASPGRLNAAFASLTASSTFRERDSRLRVQFNQISGDKRCFNEEDLTRYALNNGLPPNYVKYFIEAADKGGSGWRLPPPPGQKCITYEKFSNYVLSREEALKQMFQTLDVNNNGYITAEDLEVGLSHVRVKCPYSKCIYRCKKEVVHDFVARVSGETQSGKAFKFSEFRNFFLLMPSNEMMMDYYMSARDSSPCDIGSCVVLHKKTGGNPMGHLLAGAMSGAVSRTMTAPLETLRLMAMTGRMPEGGTIRAAQTVVRDDGWRALFRGNGVNVMRSAPQKALDFFIFDGMKRAIGGSKQQEAAASGAAVPQMSAGATLVAAGLAGATSSTILYPLEVVRSRITCDSAAAYSSVADAFRKIVAKEGVRSLYSGVGPSIAAIIPEAAITYGMFDVLKRSYSQMRGIQEPSVVESLAFGVSSAFMGQLVAYPLETVSRRMQVSTAPKQTVFEVVQGIMCKEGIPGFFGGVRASMLKVLPMAVFSFGTYEIVRLQLTQLQDQAEAAQVKKECREIHTPGGTCNKSLPTSCDEDNTSRAR